MAETDAMTMDERRKCLYKMRVRYRQAKRKRERSRLLDVRQAVTGFHFVEENLFSLVHAYVGYARPETVTQVRLPINATINLYSMSPADT